MMKAKISLYECQNAKGIHYRIYCSEGHHFGNQPDGTIDILRLKRGEPLIFAACQSCKDFDRNGKPIEPEERGWIK